MKVAYFVPACDYCGIEFGTTPVKDDNWQDAKDDAEYSGWSFRSLKETCYHPDHREIVEYTHELITCPTCLEEGS